ncbi:MAG: GH116 family glycosyl-hydrolase, partial [Alkalispirochaeta sp.]
MSPGPRADGGPWQRVGAFQADLHQGHRYDDAGTGPRRDARERAAAGGPQTKTRDDDTAPHRHQPYWHAKPGSHDDGELSGLFLGGIGAPVVGRDLDGSFARWHLQNGYHLRQSIDSAFFALRWAERGSGGSAEGQRAGGEAAANLTGRDGSSGRDAPLQPRAGYFRLASPDRADPPGGGSRPEPAPPARGPGAEHSGASRDTPPTSAPQRTVYSLFPVIHEHYRGDDLPLEVVAEFWTPLLNESEGRSTASWPVWFATITVVNRGEGDLEIDTAAFWPNLLGWRAA